MREILRSLIESIRSGRDVVACSLVETRGSTPQKAGAWMLVFPDGSQCGTLGGGCVEAEVRQRALAGLGSGEPAILTFHLDDNYGWDDGLICGGRMVVLAEPLCSGSGLDYFDAFQRLVEQGDGCAEAVVIDAGRLPDAAPGARALFGPTGELVAAQRFGNVPPSVTQHVPPVATRPRPMTHAGVAYLPLLPRCRLVVVGAGHVGQAVATLAAQADFDVWVIDDRDRYANTERFPAAERIIVGNVAGTLAELPVDSKTYVIIVTRGHSHDEEALFHLAGRPARYLGMIGSKRKIRLIFDDLLAAGVSAESLARVHAPLGLDIGSQTVPEIAVSIVAELIAHRNLGRSPEHLRGPINLLAATGAGASACLIDSPAAPTGRVP